jgi:hypothetical protein
MVDVTPRDAPEQRIYGKVLSVSVLLGLALLFASFGAYLAGLFDTPVPVDRLPEIWSRPARPALADPFSLAPIGWLALCSCAGLAAALHVYARRGDRLYVVLCALQMMVLALAASGIFTLGH